ncbi:choice-of-anchor C family protein [Candidatus Poribacteria bacterium]|nr:choice-of-anchor C family protein [Candidatus Poribacteria bacterium]
MCRYVRIVAVLLFTLASVAARAAVVSIPDPNLAAALSEATGLPATEITDTARASLKGIYAWERGITSLEGLQYAVNLTMAGLGKNAIRDVSPLAGLEHLNTLYLPENGITDARILSGLVHVRQLGLEYNPLGDIAPLAELTNITHLWLSGTGIHDVSPLASLTNLQDVALGNNLLGTLTPLSSLVNLEGLGLWSTGISDLSPLAGLTNLKRLLVQDNEIVSLEPLSGLTNLVLLRASRNHIADVSPLAGMVHLGEGDEWETPDLDLSFNMVADISPLAANPGLSSGDAIELRDNPLSAASISEHIPALRGRGVIVLARSAEPSIFPHPEFSHPLAVVGDAITSGGYLRLTQPANWQVGAAWSTTKLPVAGGFESRFRFRITDFGDRGADGLAFVIQNSEPFALGDLGGGIGYSGIANSLAVEFDTWDNSDFPDPDDNHISLHTARIKVNRTDHAYALASTSDIPRLASGATHTVLVRYAPGSFQVFLNDLTKPILSVPLRLPDTLFLDHGSAWVGFTAATGGAHESHDILSWSFVPTGGAVVANLVPNGSFEEGVSVPGGSFVEIAAGSTAIAAWTVSRGNVDYINGYWEASAGTRSIDLNGSTAGGVSTEIGTVPGHTYNVMFDLSGNPEGGPRVMRMRASAAGASADFTFDTTGHTKANMGWRTESWTFTASATRTAVNFARDISSAWDRRSPSR